MNKSSDCCDFADVSLVIATEPKGTFHSSNRFRYWRQAHCSFFNWIGMNSVLNKNVTQESKISPEKLTIRRVDLQFHVFKSLEDLAKSLNVFFSSTKKVMQSSRKGIVLFHVKPTKTFSVRGGKTGGPPVRRIDITSLLNESNGVLNVVYFRLLVSKGSCFQCHEPVDSLVKEMLIVEK